MQEYEEYAEAGFDHTHFGSSETFRNVLEKVCIDPLQYNDESLFVWWCDDGKIVTANNPITGEHYRDDVTNKDEGYASLIGIEGNLEWVALTTFIIEREAESIKGYSIGERSYI